jgi:hypothetical protein
MKSPGTKNLKSTSLLGRSATRIRYILLFGLLGLFLICGCNKTPPAENNASSAPPAAAPAVVSFVSSAPITVTLKPKSTEE